MLILGFMLFLYIFLLAFSVEAALRTFGSEEEALNYLVGQPNINAAEGANPSVPQPGTHGGGSSSADHEVGGSNAEGSGGESSSQKEAPEERDMEMEDELTEELQNADAYSDYDIEVIKEGEAINEYLALLNSAQNA